MKRYDIFYVVYRILTSMIFLLLIGAQNIEASIQDLHESESEACKMYNGVSLHNTRFAIIRSRVNNVDYKLNIFIPKDYDDKKKYPVIYLLDPHYAFPVGYSIIESLSDRKLIPSVILVGVEYKNNDIRQRYVGYETKKFSQYKANRVRDYTPVPKGKHREDYAKSYDKYSGNAGKFRMVLSDTIVPYINRKYSTSGNNTIVGHSYGGLFVMFLFLTQKGLFSNYLAISPSLWYEDDVIFSMINPTIIDPQSSVYIAVGENETKRMIDRSEKMYNQVRKYSNAKYEVLDKNDHMGSLFVGFLHGIRYVLNNSNK